ncbi:DEAD-domain-containing protein [Sporormia fimetaria CBS 119925]|uniref:RNA helicase n=1 Tax=Sporormia fimetaria CBS 119925 TaxID=1340428 RepID=A0A6A6V924_9PLEO|nr:DEAD-domain-containing protein [Sporormia fimetaria CBS 119925]
MSSPKTSEPTAAETATTAEPTPETQSAGGETQVDGAAEPSNGSGLQEPEYDVEVKLADLQADPNNPLFSAKSFEELQLSPELLKGIRAMNFSKPSKIQEKALPLLLLNPPMNMIAQSQSGTGKTAAFSLNILSRLDLNNISPQALVLAPSRELARQILGVIELMGGQMPGLKVAAAIPNPKRRSDRIDAHVIVGTPGTVMDMIRRKNIDPRNLKVLVLDEADNMLDQQGMGDQSKRVKQLVPRNLQIVLFSATFPAKVIQFAHQFAPNANVLTLAADDLTIEGIKQLYVDVNADQDKYATLLKFYELMTQASSIIFVNSRRVAEELEQRMTAEGHKVAQLTGALDGQQRDEVIDRFRRGEAKVLIATNVIARGIDVQTVTMVINYDVPVTVEGRPDPETYLHRIGRTGRFGRVGVALTFVHDKRSWQNLNEIATHFNTELHLVDTGDWDAVEQMISKIVKSGRAGKSTKEMTGMDS